MRRSYSGQLLGSVKPAPSGYAGSNPARRTKIQNAQNGRFEFLFLGDRIRTGKGSLRPRSERGGNTKTDGF